MTRTCSCGSDVFKRLHRNTLSNVFHGDVLAYESEGRNHRFVLCSRMIDEVRKRPESEWVLPEVGSPARRDGSVKPE